MRRRSHTTRLYTLFYIILGCARGRVSRARRLSDFPLDTDPTASSTPTHVVFMLKLGTHRPNFIVITRNIWSPCASHVAAMFVTTVSFFSLAMSFGPKTSSPEPPAPNTKSHSGTSKQAVADDHTHTCTRFGSVKFSSMRMATPAAPPVPENHPVGTHPAAATTVAPAPAATQRTPTATQRTTTRAPGPRRRVRLGRPRRRRQRGHACDVVYEYIYISSESAFLSHTHNRTHRFPPRTGGRLMFCGDLFSTPIQKAKVYGEHP